MFELEDNNANTNVFELHSLLDSWVDSLLELEDNKSLKNVRGCAGPLQL